MPKFEIATSKVKITHTDTSNGPELPGGLLIQTFRQGLNTNDLITPCFLKLLVLLCLDL
jgi:hypothetical protein